MRGRRPGPLDEGSKRGIIPAMNRMKKWFGQLWLKQKNNKSHRNPVTIIPRTQHTISRSDISGHALQVMRQLHHAGFDAYLVGGCVRDLLLGKHPKDFDVVTNAKPNEIKGLFRNCYLPFLYLVLVSRNEFYLIFLQ